MDTRLREKLVSNYLNTSVDDMKISIANHTDPKLLLSLLYNCNLYSFESKSKVVEARITKLIKAGVK